MYCLSCAQEVAYKSLECPSCKGDLRYPSHGYGDHVSQVLQAVESACQGNATVEHAESVYRQFLLLAQDFLHYWRLDTHPGLSQRVGGMEGFDQLQASLPGLQRALESYDRGFSQNCKQTLIEANSELEAFFRASCAAIARVRALSRNVFWREGSINND